MNLSEIHVGDRIPNYRALCKTLDLPIEAGNSKKAQLTELRRYFSWEKSGNAFIIQEIFDTPQAKKDGRQKYIQYVEPLLMNYLCGCDQPVVESNSLQEWYRLIGLAPESFFDVGARSEFQEQFCIDNFSVSYTINCIHGQLRDIFMNTLNHLRRKGVFYYYEQLLVKLDDEKKQFRVATQAQKQEYKEMQNEAANELGFSNLYGAMMSQQRYKRYKEALREKMTEHRWLQAYKIVYIHIPKALDSSYENVDLPKLKAELNSEIRKSVMKKISREYTKNNQKAWDLWIESNESDEKSYNFFEYPPFLSSNAGLLLEELFSF